MSKDTCPACVHGKGFNCKTCWPLNNPYLDILPLKEGHVETSVNACKPGEYIRLVVNGPVYIRGAFDRGSKSYELTRFDDIGRTRFVKGARLVFVGFTF